MSEAEAGPVSGWALLTGASIFLFGAGIHWSAPLLGPDWYAFLEAPASVVASARQDTPLATVGVGVIGGLMFACALYGLAARSRTFRPPLLRTALVAISLVCLLRGLILIPLVLVYPGRFKTEGFDIVASVVWFLAGATYLMGLIGSWRRLGRSGARVQPR